MNENKKVYSDGDIEKSIIDALNEGKSDKSICDMGGAAFHNFTDARENLINWYPFEKSSSILEIGAGMGALTGLLCQNAEKVIALEQSPKRAEIIRIRHRAKHNLEVVCDDVYTYNFAQKFDYILLIGVLEYVGINSEFDRPYHTLLKRIYELLKPTGKLLLAIENRFGLKYWCGASEDHTGVSFDGISGYKSNSYTTRYNNSGVCTFSKDELNTFFSTCGFKKAKWYYPLPDYKFPMAIFSDEYLPTDSDIDAIKFTYPVESELIANEKELYKDVISNGVFPFFANSFFVEVSKNSDESAINNILYASLKRDYKKEYRIATLIDDSNQVIKKGLSASAENHLREYHANTVILQKRGIKMVPIEAQEQGIVHQWQSLVRADKVFQKLLEDGNWTGLCDLVEKLKYSIVQSSENYQDIRCSLFDEDILFEKEELIMKNGYTDMTFVNSFWDGNDLVFFDQEWNYSDIPLKYILYRAVKYSYQESKSISLEKIYTFIGIDNSMVNIFDKAENKMLLSMMDKQKCDMFDPNMYHDALTLRFKQNLLNDGYAKVENEKQKLENDLQNEKQKLEEISRKLRNIELINEKQKGSLKNQEQEIAKQKTEIDLQKDKLMQMEREIENSRQTICNKEGHIEQLLEVEREYEREKHSRTYRMALGFRKISTFFFPVDSKRRFFARLIGKGLRHPILMIKMINVRRIKNCFTILRTEDAASALNHFRLVEEYERSRDIPVEGVDIVPITEAKKTIEAYEVLLFEQYEKPMVSIVIPVYNQFEYTYSCLKSILMNSGECTYEIIIANDCSTDLTIQLGDVVKGINIINNTDNLRFLLNCNNAAKYAKGEYILFLNNDTQVQQNWLQPLIDLMKKDATIGMVGSKLIYADGYLQEAGGILWDDASAWNYGNRQNPNDSEFNFVHEVDYISGAAIMIRTKLWKEIGGFDERFVPAYCEDSDLAFEVRKHGYKVVYQPKSVVVHFEGISNGTDVTTGQKKYQVENQKKFYEKWKDELKQNHFPNGQDVFLARERGKGKKHILVIDHYVPQYDKDAGSKTTFMYLKMLVGKGYQITFLGDNFYQHEPYTTELQQMGIFVLYGPKYAEHWKEWLMENMQYFDIFYLNRPHITIKYIDFIKEHARGKIIYYGHDLHFLRIQREYELDGREEELEESEKWKKQELYIMRQADMNYYPSMVEEEAIHEIDSKIPVKAITAYVYEKFMNVTYEPEKREGILFVGGFGHAPNLDAVQWFLDKIYPDVYKNIKANFYIVGSKAPDEITHITTEGVIVKGFVSEEELKQLYNSCRLVVVPLRYGAGVKGKVVEALYYGIPIVTTSVGAEGIGGIENIVVVEDQEQKLVNAICEVYQNDDKLIEMSEKSQRYVREKFSTEAVWDIVKEDFE